LWNHIKKLAVKCVLLDNKNKVKDYKLFVNMKSTYNKNKINNNKQKKLNLNEYLPEIYNKDYITLDGNKYLIDKITIKTDIPYRALDHISANNKSLNCKTFTSKMIGVTQMKKLMKK
jgi:hypothetical protein